MLLLLSPDGGRPDAERESWVDIILASWHHSITMRTTLNVADDVLDVAKEMAYIRQISVGEAVSMLARRGMNVPVSTRKDPVSGLFVFDVPDDAPELTQEMVERAQELEDLEYAKYFRKP
jgi:hypothetical protein